MIVMIVCYGMQPHVDLYIIAWCIVSWVIICTGSMMTRISTLDSDPSQYVCMGPGVLMGNGHVAHFDMWTVTAFHCAPLCMMHPVHLCKQIGKTWNPPYRTGILDVQEQKWAPQIDKMKGSLHQNSVHTMLYNHSTQCRRLLNSRPKCTAYHTLYHTLWI